MPRYGSTTIDTAVLNGALTLPIDDEVSSRGAIQVTGSFAGAAITPEGTIDEVTWAPLLLVPANSETSQLTITAAGVYRLDVGGLVSVRFRVSTAAAGSAVLSYNDVLG